MGDDQKIDRTPEEQDRCVKLYDDSRAELLKRELSNSEAYDKAILSLSSAFLAFSLTAIKFIVILDCANHLWSIKTSWILFGITICLSLLAYIIGNKAIEEQLFIEQNYYIEALVKYRTEKNRFTSINYCINKITGIVFVVAIGFLIFFIFININ